MTIAEIHGKSPLTTSEDILTANVFTAFRYLPAGSGIIGFLRSIKGVSGMLPKPNAQASAEYFFWPLGRTREPDVLLELGIDGEIYHVMVEAKYLSGPSDAELVEVDEEEETIPWGNQLADQLRDLMMGKYTIRGDGSRDQTKMLESKPENRLLLYLTAHPLRPRKELERSVILHAEGADRLFWASWYDVHDYLQSNRDSFSAFPFNRVVDDLLQLLCLKTFSSLQGMRQPPQLPEETICGRFWQGRDKPLPRYYGVRLPQPIPTAAAGGSFWRGGGS